MKKTILVIAVLLLFTITFCFSTDSVKTKKISFDLNFNYSFLIQGPGFNTRAKANKELLSQYFDLINTTYTSSGAIESIKTIPIISLSFNYHLNSSLLLTLGAEYSNIKKTYQTNIIADVFNVQENYNFDYNCGVSIFRPYIGVEKKIKDFSLGFNIGLAFTGIAYTENIGYSEESHSENQLNSINANSSSISFSGGIKYFINIFKNIKTFIKVEFLYLNSTNFKGEKSANNQLVVPDGIVYTYNTNPYQSWEVNTWDLLEEDPISTGVANMFEPFNLDLSTLRISIGIRL